MAKPKKASRGGLTPGKSVMIGILAVVLLVVIVSQSGGKKKPVAIQPRAKKTASGRAESTASPPSTPAPTVAPRSAKPWPTFDVAVVVASNPFVLPEELRDSGDRNPPLASESEGGEVAAIMPAEIREMHRRQAEFLESLRVKGVDMVLRSGRGSVARIGDLTLRVGDVHEGLRVESIGPQGVVFTPAVRLDGQLE